ncbi:MAG: hypothetical protein D3X82_13610 [Candidatus Leucobacter sulfamidivorax]|nr:hypothetical protein [Candidatus Leucobacter sulfamidivorax]
MRPPRRDRALRRRPLGRRPDRPARRVPAAPAAARSTRRANSRRPPRSSASPSPGGSPLPRWRCSLAIPPLPGRRSERVPRSPRVYLQPDLSLIVPGPLPPGDERSLAEISEAEQWGVAATLRLSPASLRRALRGGWSTRGSANCSHGSPSPASPAARLPARRSRADARRRGGRRCAFRCRAPGHHRRAGRLRGAGRHRRAGRADRARRPGRAPIRSGPIRPRLGRARTPPRARDPRPHRGARDGGRRGPGAQLHPAAGRDHGRSAARDRRAGGGAAHAAALGDRRRRGGLIRPVPSPRSAGRRG